MPGVVARGAATGSQAGDFVRSGLPNSGSWTPTLVHPGKSTSTANVLMFWGHLLLHVISLGLSGFNGFGITLLQKGDSACAITDMSCFTTAPNGGLVAISIAGSSSQVIGVVLILVFSAFIYANQLKKYIWATSLMFFFLNFSMASSFLVWGMSAYRYHSLAFWLSSFGVVIQLWSLMMVFSTAAALGSKNIVRTFVMTSAVALDLILALLYQVGTFSNLGGHIDPTQKSIMWIAFGTQTGAQVVLLLGRMFTGSNLNLKTISKYPFFRSIVLLLFGVSAICASIRFTVTDNIYITLYTSFTLPATILSWWTFVYAILPTDSYTYPPKSMKEEYDENDTEEMDEEEYDDEEEGVEAAYRRGIKMNRVQVRK